MDAITYLATQLALVLEADYTNAPDENAALCMGIAQYMNNVVIPNLQVNSTTGAITFVVPAST
jgi:hypothetical protein